MIEPRGYNKAVVALANKKRSRRQAYRCQRCGLRTRTGIQFGLIRLPQSLQSR